MKSLECDWGEEDAALQAPPRLLLDTCSHGSHKKGVSSPPIPVLDLQTDVPSLPDETVKDTTTRVASGEP